MHNEALTPNAPDPTPSRKVTPARALAVVSPDPQDRGAANDAAQARSARDSQKAETTTNPRETGLASTRARTSALFLTQLIACARRLPAYRERRRAAPDEAVRAYGAASVPHRRSARVISDF